MELPASEINFWRDYYSIYPFPQERDDFRMARVLEMLNTSAQGMGFKNKTWEFFLPDYLGTRDRVAESEQEQIAAEKAFASEYTEALRRAKDA